MSSSHQIRAYEYVNRPYESVARALRRDAVSIFQLATGSSSRRARTLSSTLRANLGPIELSAEVVVQVTSVQEDVTTAFGPRTRLHIGWQAGKYPQLFPIMTATLDVYGLGPEETQLDFHGEYAPPLGMIGAALDDALGHRIAEATVHRFVDEVASKLCDRQAGPRHDQ